MPQLMIPLRAPLLALVLLFAACQQQAPPISNPAENSPEPTAEAAVAAPDQPDALPEDGPVPEVPASAEQAPVTLNLEIPKDLLDEQGDTGFPQTENRYLPDMFAKKKKTGTSVSGELLLDEEQDFSIDAVTGAKINVEIPVD